MTRWGEKSMTELPLTLPDRVIRSSVGESAFSEEEVPPAARRGGAMALHLLAQSLRVALHGPHQAPQLVDLPDPLLSPLQLSLQLADLQLLLLSGDLQRLGMFRQRLMPRQLRLQPAQAIHGVLVTQEKV